MWIKCEKNWIKLMDKRIQTEFESSFFFVHVHTQLFIRFSFLLFCINEFYYRDRLVTMNNGVENSTFVLTGSIERLNNWLLTHSFGGCASIMAFSTISGSLFKVFLLILHLAQHCQWQKAVNYWISLN